jgi:hypothetical protein
MRGANPAVTRQPNAPTSHPAVLRAAAAMLLHEGVESGE